MSSKISSQSSVKTVWRNVAVAVFAVCFALLGLCVTVIPSRATDDDTFITIGEIYNNPANMQKLYDALRGATAGTTYAQIADLAEQKQNAQNFRELNNGQDIKVMFGGYEWHVCYLSNDTDGNPILTLLSAVSMGTAQWNTYSTDDANVIYPCKMYATSYIRSVTLNNGGDYATSTTTRASFTQNDQSPLAKFTMPNVQGTVTDLIVTPSKIQWQATQKSKSILATGNNTLNESWQDEKGWYAGSGNDVIANNSLYGNWQNDYVWLPSVSEAVNDGGAMIGLWKLSFNQIQQGNAIWSRSGDYSGETGGYGNIKNLVCQISKIGYPETVPTDVAGVCPAIHVNLNAAELAANFAEKPTITTVYNGADQRVEKMSTKPEWYHQGLTITYANHDGALVTEVKDVGEYTGTVTAGAVSREFTITIAPQEITGDNNVTARPKTYDRTTNVTLDDSHYTLTGVFPGDNITTKITGAFTDFNVGEQDVNVSVKLDGAAAGNYVLTNPTFTIKATIDPRSVTVSNIAVKAKPYDGTNRAIIDASNATFVAVGFDLSADDLTVAVSGTYDQITVGHDWTVTLNVVLDGATAGNYVLGDGSQKQVEHCAITQREITVTINDQTVKVGDAVNLSARVTSGSLANGDNADDVYTLAIELPADAEYDINNLPAGEYTITGADANTEIAKNYDVKFVNGKYTVLTAEAWDALQTKDDEGKGDNNAWLVIIIVIAVAAFIGALVGIGLVVRSHDRTPKPAKGKSNKIDKATKTDAELTSGKNAQPQAE